MEFDKVLFYNFAHSGDIHVSRSLVKYVMDNMPDKKFSYWHTKAPNILSDIKNLQHMTIMSGPENIMKWGWFVHEGTLMCNTWYHAFESQEYKGCTIQTLFNIFKRGLKETVGMELPGDPIDYLPEVDFETFFKGRKGIRMIDRLRNLAPVRRTLIVNCDVLSGQSDNFDFNPTIVRISQMFPLHYFVVTNVKGVKLNMSNVCYAEDIIGKEDNNLNEIAYLSYFCNVVVGRASGPYTFSLIRRNLLDEKKTFVCFSNEDFGIVNKIKAKTIMSEDYSRDNVIKIMEKAIIERYPIW